MSFKHSPTRSQRTFSKAAFPTTLGLLAAAIVQAALPSMALAGVLPTNGVVAQGSANITTAGNVMTVNQSSTHAVINFKTHDVASGHAMHYVTPEKGSTLSQISGAASKIDGTLTSTGALFLVNPNGIVFGKNASVNVGSLVATTNSIAPKEFVKGAASGTLDFAKGGKGGITNEGMITAGSGGYVVLAGAGNILNGGTIKVPNGTIQMVSADQFSLSLPTANQYLQLAVNGKASGANVTADKNGSLTAGSVTLQADRGTVTAANTAIYAQSLGDLKGQITLSGKHVAVKDITDDGIYSQGGITFKSTGTTQLSNVDMSAKKDLTIQAGDSIYIGNSMVNTQDRGTLTIASGKTVYLDRAVVSATHGDIDVSGKGGGSMFGKAPQGAVTLNNSKLDAMYGGKIVVSADQSGATAKTHNGLHMTNSKLRAEGDIHITGNGLVGVNQISTSIKSENNVSIKGVSDAKNGVGVKLEGSSSINKGFDSTLTVSGVTKNNKTQGLQLGEKITFDDQTSYLNNGVALTAPKR